MKQILLATLLTVFLFTACKKDTFKVNSLEVKAESEKAPVKVQIITETEGKGAIEYTIFHSGAYSSLEGTEEDAIESMGPITIDRKGSKEVYTDTLTVYYRNAGTYEISLQVKDGETLTESFTLTSNLELLQGQKWKLISAVLYENGEMFDIYAEEVTDDVLEFKENMEYFRDFGELRHEVQPEFDAGTYYLSANQDTLYMSSSNDPIFLKILNKEKMEWESIWTEFKGSQILLNGVWIPIE